MDYFPAFLKINGSRVLLVGGGKVALRKARLLARAGAELHVVAPELVNDLGELVRTSSGKYYPAPFRSELLDGMKLVVAATDQQETNEVVSQAAGIRNILVNVVDQPDLCTFIFPSIVDRSPLMIAISSGGQSPVLARAVRTQIESLIPSSYGVLAKFVGRFRELVKQAVPEDHRRHFWERIIYGPIGGKVLAGREQQAEEALHESLNATLSPRGNGEVYLIGAGPGDPDLLSLKALRLLQMADVVLYDRLVSAPIVDLARRDAERIYVGKARDKHTVPQTAINQLLVDLAKQGKCVVRLKGGDPFIFGRGGEEIELLAENQIPFQVVPGITAASGCASYAGIPLTHRDYAQSVRFVTGHLKDGSVNLPWQEFVVGQQTLVFYMGLKGLPIICAQLIAHGKDKNSAIALIERGTLPNQRVLTGTLDTMVELVSCEVVHAPTLIIVGEVVQLHRRLSWFGQ
jgi:uroporphyrin-III C-methyltransferase/precorrin-2 dehydrogenase/sirohydrochlorin ferrochelatase